MLAKRKITILVGLPGSGKSTWAKEQVNSSEGKIKRVNKDDLRTMLGQEKYSKGNENLVLALRDEVIQVALTYGYDVVVDDTNLHPKHINRITELWGDHCEIEIREFDTPIEVCIERDFYRSGKAHVGEAVIRRMDRERREWAALSGR